MRLKRIWWGLQEKAQWVRELLCDHRWVMCRLQPLVPGTSYECVKCGKIDHAD